MNFTFGIITDGTNPPWKRLESMIMAIRREVPRSKYEIIIIGGGNRYAQESDINQIDFMETAPKIKWITRKKNLITENAKFDNIVYMHDYLELCFGWYDAFLKYGDDWEICMNRIINYDGTRYRDWALWPGSIVGSGDWTKEEQERMFPNMKLLLPYSVTNLTRYMYISGAYWVAKKHVMQEFKLDETKGWAQGEDVEWSLRVNKKYDFSINEKSVVKVIKPGKDAAFIEIDPEHTEYLKSKG